MSHEAIENLSHEDRAFPPSAEFAAQANATAALYDEAAADRVAFWERQARELTWADAVDHGARLVERAVREVVRRRQAQRRGQLRRPARRAPATATRSPIHFEGEPGDTRDITYAELLAEVSPGGERARRRSASRPATASRSTCR